MPILCNLGRHKNQVAAFGFIVVHIRPVHQQDRVRILLYRAAVPQVGKPWLFVCSLFAGAIELRKA